MTRYAPISNWFVSGHGPILGLSDDGEAPFVDSLVNGVPVLIDEDAVPYQTEGVPSSGYGIGDESGTPFVDLNG